MNTALIQLITIDEARECATLMASIDPWVTRKRSYDDCLKLFLDRSREIFIMKDNGMITAFSIIEKDAFSQPFISMIGVRHDYRGKGIEESIVNWLNENMLIKNDHTAVYATGDRNKMDIEFIYNNLKTLYWATNITRENLIGRIMNSMCFGVFANGSQKGFARVVTDYFSFAYLADVFIEEKERGKGYSRILIEYIIDYPLLKDIKWLLATRDMHELYAKFGFTSLNNPDRF